MVRTKVTCEKCGREISKSNLTKHLKSHETHPENFKKETYHLDHDDLFCKFCGKECKNKNSLVQHEIRCKENPGRKLTAYELYPEKYIGKFIKTDTSWNKGLTKETDERVKQSGLNLHNNILSGKTKVYGHKHSEETKKKISYKRTLYLKNNPDKHPWKNDSKFKSKPCEDLKEYLSSVGFIENIDWIAEAKVVEHRNFSIDICFPSIKLCLEVNGNQHYKPATLELKDYYLEREKIIKECGWKIIQIHYLNVYNNQYLLRLVDYIKNLSNTEDCNFLFNNEKLLDIIKDRNNEKQLKQKHRENEISYFKSIGLVDSSGKINKSMISLQEKEKRRDAILNSGIDLTKFGYMKNLINYFKGLYTAKQLSYIINCFSIPHFERKKHV